MIAFHPVGALAVFFGAWVIYEYALPKIRPVKGRITSPYGEREHPISGQWHFHNGTDYAGDVGDPIIAPESGVVESVYTHDRGGLSMIVKTITGKKLGFAHLDEAKKKPGDYVIKGMTIATVGDSGNVTGPHLHFTVRDKDGGYENPEEYLF
ncbi:M23 family metallopeptidase [Phaeocystidibacter luteus]|uniref:M23 family metallopeptidase n=1 Tax=Phaeocystidibacter luteus TaxID=911197 RepID=A0A6N6RLX2_9FLAO|nr:M23 family metallopeptidase [Phaeocystidibacter luteus]KAB2814577.1 M23 family metallopeptidase [Phaeocystidibacter luteus]